MPLKSKRFAFLLLVLSFFLLGSSANAQSSDGNEGSENQTEVESAEAEASETDNESDAEQDIGPIQRAINETAQSVVQNVLFPTLFYGIPTGITEVQRYQSPDEPQQFVPMTIPLILFVLCAGGTFFTLRFGFVNIRLFTHCIQVIRGKFDREDDEGEVSHFQALTSALSATVGLGNIANVAVAICIGGPGAVFWMWCIAFFGMSSKFSSCTLSQLYRRIKPDGSVLGGPMIYLQEGIKERIPTLAPLGRLLAIVYAIFTTFGAFGGGNMFQGNQTFSMLRLQFGLEQRHAPIVGIILGLLVGMVIIGGIRRIGSVTSKLVPLMCGAYCFVCIVIIFMNLSAVPGVFSDIFSQAFSPNAFFGGMIAVFIQGARRAAFSNEAGMGSAAIAHAAAKTDEPVREGVVAMIGPFIDTIVVCTMTALAILVTSSHLEADGTPMTEAVANARGVEVTAAAFASLGPALPYFLCIAVFVFAYSTMISWSYYGERAIEYLFGMKAILPYRIVYVLFVVLGPMLSLQAVLDFSDMMLLSMAFPNIIGMVLLSGLVAGKLRDYNGRLKSGEMKPQS